ncbi:MAG: hypothetical protein E6G25_01430 [Actinobacteria bacterium]|nr:MAG: hypothetical protein E6G25_01430 [Actinomycetota bacterium]
MSAVQDRVWTDPELADLLRDDPRLVAIADALRESGGVVVQRRRRRRILRGALMAAALCVAVAVALVAPWSNSGNGSLADRALAVIGTQPVLHVVVELAPQGQLIDLKTGAAAPLSEQREIWYDGDRALEHTVYRAGGVVVWDQLETPQGEVSSAGPHTFSREKPTIEPALQGFVDGYREALASGAAKQTGQGSFEGVAVVWLSFALPGGDSEEVAVAEDSGRPLFVKMCSGSCWTYRVKTIETMSVDSADFSQPVESEAMKHQFSGGKNDRNLLVVPVSSVPDAVPGAVWAGSSVEGLPLASATRENFRTRFGDRAAEDWSGAQLVYGAMSSAEVPDFEQPFVQIWESVRSVSESAYAGPRLPPLPVSELDGRLYVPWTGAQPPSPSAPLAMNALTGYAVVNGVHVTVRASSGELLVAAARALRPIG